MGWVLAKRKPKPLGGDLAKPVLSLHQIDKLEAMIEPSPENRRMVRKLFHTARAAVYLEFEAIDHEHQKDEWERKLQTAEKIIQRQTMALAGIRKHSLFQRKRRRGK